MSKLLGQLTGVGRQQLGRITDRLEHMSNVAGVDAQLTADVVLRVRDKSRLLGLDPKDTTPRELYHALQHKAVESDKILRGGFGLDGQDDTARVAAGLQTLVQNEQCLTIQPAALKQLLKAVPPKATLRALKFRSIDAVLKREDPIALYALASYLEEASWGRQVAARMKRFKLRDCGTSTVHVIALPLEWQKKLTKVSFDQAVKLVPEVGAVMILPSIPLEEDGAALLLSTMVLQASEQLAAESLPFYMQVLHRASNELVQEIAAGKRVDVEPIFGLQPAWTVVYRLLMSTDVSYTDIHQLGIVRADMNWQSIETKLSVLANELDFWVGTHFLGAVSGDVVTSMHVADVAANVVMNRQYEQQFTTHLESSAWNELSVRYMQQDVMQKRLFSQILPSMQTDDIMLEVI